MWLLLQQQKTHLHVGITFTVQPLILMCELGLLNIAFYTNYTCRKQVKD